MEQFVVDQQHTVFANDALLSAQPLTSESNTPAEISAKFGTITYSKGTGFLDIMPTIKIVYCCLSNSLIFNYDSYIFCLITVKELIIIFCHFINLFNICLFIYWHLIITASINLSSLYFSRWLCAKNVEAYPHTRNLPKRSAKISKQTVSHSGQIKILKCNRTLIHNN